MLCLQIILDKHSSIVKRKRISIYQNTQWWSANLQGAKAINNIMQALNNKNMLPMFH